MSATKSSKIKKLVIAGSVVVLVLGGVAVFAPQIASNFVPGIVQTKAGEQILGSVQVGSASLSWSGPQKITGVRLLDPENKEVALVDVEATVGLMSLIRGSFDLGEVSVGGKALIVRDAKGVTNLQRATAMRNAVPSTKTTVGGGSAPATKVPAGLKVKAKVTNFDVTFADEGAVAAGAQYSMVSLPNLSGEAQLGVGQPTTLALKSDVNASAGKTAPALKGSFSVNGTVDGLISADGTVQPDKAKADVKVRATTLPVAVLDLIAGQQGRLAKGLGATLDMASDIKGDYNAGSVSFTMATANHAAASGTLNVKDGVLTSSEAITATIPGTALVELVPSLRESLNGSGGLEVTTFPDAVLKVESIVFKLPKNALDLRGSGMVAQLTTAPLQGTLKIEGQPAKRVDITGLDVKIAAMDFAGDVRTVVKCNATVDGQSAGSIDTDLTVGGLLDANGGIKGGMPGKLDGRATIQGASTAIIEPFVKAYKIMPQEDIGKTLNAEILARTPKDTGRGGYDVEIKVGSDRVSADGAFAVTETSVRSITRPFSARVLSAGAIASRFMPPDSWQLRPTGAMDLVVKDVDIPFVKDAKTGASSMNLAGASLGVAARLFGLEIMPPKGTVSPVTLSVKALDLGLAMAPKAAARFTMSGDMAAGKEAFGVEGDVALEGLVGPTGIDTSKLAPLGRVAIKNLPTSLASMFNPASKPGVTSTAGAAAAPGATAMDLGPIARDVLGPSVTITTNLAASKGKAATDVTTSIVAAHSTTTVDAQLSGALMQPTEVVVRTFSGEVNLQPTALDSLLRTFMPDLRERPQLVEASQIKFSVDPVTIPLSGGAGGTDLSKLGTINAKLQLPGRTLVRGLTRTDANGQTIPVAPAGVENLELAIKAPASIGVNAGKIDATFKTRLLSQDAPDGTLASISGSAQVDMAAPNAKTPDASRLAGINADMKIGGVATAALDKLNATPGMLSGLLGETLAADLTAKITGADASTRTIAIEMSPKAPRLAVSKPIRVTVSPDRMTFGDDTKFDLQLDPTFANAFVFKPDATGKSQGKLLKAVPLSMTISKLAFSRDPSGKDAIGPLKTGIFEMTASAEAASAMIELADGQQLTLGRTVMSAQAPKAGGPLAFNVQVDSSELKAGKAAPQAVQKVTLAGTVDKLADAAGKVDTQHAIVNATANVPAFPTAIIDALAKQNGMLNDALGPMVSANMKAERLQLGKGATGDTGTLDLQMQSPRATFKLKGTVQNGAFATTAPAEITIIEVTPALSGRISKNIPFIGSITKTKDLKPGLLRAENLTAPLDGDLSKLNADITIDLGEALVAPGGLVNDLLNIKIPAVTGAIDQTGMNEAKKVGERLKPVPVKIRNGVMTYAEFKLPLGEFEIENSGSIDLGKRLIDAVVWIPMGRLAGEAVPGLSGTIDKIPLLGNVAKGSFNEFTMIPFRLTGSMDGKISREFSAELFAGRVGKTIGNGAAAGDVLKGIGDLFKKKDKEPKK